MTLQSNLDPGWWRSQTGPAQVVILAGGVLFGFALIWFFALSTPGKPRVLPAVVGQGQAMALNRLDDAGFHGVESHDAWGRDRDGDARDWQVCFQTPKPGGPVPEHAKIELGVVKTTERCPGDGVGDQGVIRKLTIDDRLPDLTAPISWTAHIVAEDFGDDASLRFVDQSNQDHQITRDLGDWKVCDQTPAAGEVWSGRPVVAWVVPYDRGC